MRAGSFAVWVEELAIAATGSLCLSCEAQADLVRISGVVSWPLLFLLSSAGLSYASLLPLSDC